MPALGNIESNLEVDHAFWLSLSGRLPVKFSFNTYVGSVANMCVVVATPARVVRMNRLSTVSRSYPKGYVTKRNTCLLVLVLARILL